MSKFLATNKSNVPLQGYHSCLPWLYLGNNNSIKCHSHHVSPGSLGVSLLLATQQRQPTKDGSENPHANGSYRTFRCSPPRKLYTMLPLNMKTTCLHLRICILQDLWEAMLFDVWKAFRLHHVARC